MLTRTKTTLERPIPMNTRLEAPRHRLAFVVSTALVLLAVGASPLLAQDPMDLGYVTLNGPNAKAVAVILGNAILGTIDVVGRPTGVAVSQDGAFVYVASVGPPDTLSVIDSSLIAPWLADKITMPHPVVGSVSISRFPEGVAVTPDGTKVYVVGFFAGDAVTVVDSSDPMNPTRIVPGITGAEFGSSRFDVAIAEFTANGVLRTYAFVSNTADGRVVVIDTVSDTVLTSFPTGAGAQGVAASADGSRVYVANSSGTVSEIDTAKVVERIEIDGSVDPVISQFTLPGGPLGVAVSPDGATVVATLHNTTDIGVIDIAGGTPPSLVALADKLWGVSFTKDGGRILAASTLNEAHYMDFIPVPTPGTGTLNFNPLFGGQESPRWVSFVPGEAPPPPDLSHEFERFALRFAKVSTRGRFADFFFFNGYFTVDTTDGNSIDLKNDSVVIKIESQTFEIPPNAFRGYWRGRLFRFKGIVDDAKLLVYITRRGRHSNLYNITVSGWNAKLEAVNKLEMCLQIGDDSGCTEKYGRIR